MLYSFTLEEINMQKGYKREGRGMAVLRCFIGLFVMIVVILLVYFLLKLDYSDKLEPGASIRPYVETTLTPEPSAVPEVTSAPTADAEATSEATAEPEATIEATATPEPTDAPTPEPTAEPTPEPTATPEPTSIPSSAVAALKFSGFKLPSLSTKTAQLGVTHSYRSAADSNRYLHLQGYAYIDEADYDGANAELYLVVIRSTGHTALALPNRAVGISGVDHADAQCKNASSSDFDVVLDVSKFPDDSYTLGMVFVYKDANGNSVKEYCTFPTDMSFSVLSGQAISDVKTVSE